MYRHQNYISIFSFLICITLFSFVMPQIDFIFETQFRFINATLALAIIVFPVIEALLRYISIQKHYDPGKFFFDCSIRFHYVRPFFYFVFFIVLFLIAPLLKGLIFLTPFKLALRLTAWLCVIVCMLYITKKRTRVYFMSDAILVKGLDLRLAFPVNERIRTDSGIYTYKHFSAFYQKDSLLLLLLKDSQGEIRCNLPTDKIVHIVTFLLSKDIRRIHEHEINQYT